MTINQQAILDYITEEFGTLPELIKPGSRLVEDFNLDSLDKMELSLELEDRFDIEISDEEEHSIKTVQDIFDLVDKKLEEKE